MANGLGVSHDHLILVNGGRFDLWVSKADVVGRFIKEQQLKPIGMEHLMVRAANLAAMTKVPVEMAAPSAAMTKRVSAAAQIRWHWPWPWPFPGGMRIPHLHYAGDVYALKDEQWQEFTKKVVTDFAEKLVNAEKIGFDQLMDISEAVGTIR